MCLDMSQLKFYHLLSFWRYVCHPKFSYYYNIFEYLNILFFKSMVLTQKRAQERFKHIKTQSIQYRFHLILQTGSYYDGFSQIDFFLNQVPSELVLDCKAKQIKNLIINQKVVQKVKHEDGFLFLNSEFLSKGSNHVGVIYRNKYDNDGNGCVSFIDVDKKQYLYTQFEPYYANRVFTLFDQPDLKASMQLSIIYPTEWQRVLSNQYATIDEDLSSQKYMQNISSGYKKQVKDFIKNAKGRMSIFPKTKLLPTYLYCFVAGPYKRLQLKETYKNIPMSLYCIQSLFTFMSGMADFIFQITIESMKFFERFFGVDYPFQKYDQVFAHQYKCGAMQNAGIVTFNDQYIWREKVSTETMLDLANTISHQLSHHWFGNLSTMKWWDDLWLNQSFAEFISHFCLEKIKDNLKTIKYESSMASFLARKAWGYHEDQLITTHPIRGEVQNTLVAASIFDGITYAKGAATMKQLLLLMGQQNFSKGLCSYFKKYGFKNATLQDFINELQVHFKNQHLTLQQWRKFWLETSSLNQLQPNWDPSNHSENAILEIIQTLFAPEHPTLRPHKIKIGLFKQDCTIDVVEALVKPEQKTIVKYNGSSKYKALLLNYEDHTFAKVIIDKASLDFFSSGHLVEITDTLTRTLIWRSFYDMVKDGIISSMRYIDIFQSNISQEKSDSIFQRHFEYVHAAINTYTPKLYRDQLNARLFYFILSLIQKTSPADQNRLVILKSQLCDYAHCLLSVRVLMAWREGRYTPLKNHEMTVVQKWKCVVRAFEQKQISNEEKNKLLEDQLKLDPSDQSKLQQAKCRALLSTEEQFQDLYISFKNPNNERSITLKRYMISGWNHDYHQQRLKKYKQRYFQEIIGISRELDGDHFQLLLEDMSPNDDNLKETIKGLKGLKFGDEEKFDKIKRDTLKIIGDLQRRDKAYTKFEQFCPL